MTENQPVIVTSRRKGVVTTTNGVFVSRHSTAKGDFIAVRFEGGAVKHIRPANVATA